MSGTVWAPGLGAGRQHECCACATLWRERYEGAQEECGRRLTELRNDIETYKHELSNAEYERDCKESALRHELDHVRPRLDKEIRALRANIPKSVLRRLIAQKAIENFEKAELSGDWDARNDG